MDFFAAAEFAGCVARLSLLLTTRLRMQALPLWHAVATFVGTVKVSWGYQIEEAYLLTVAWTLTFSGLLNGAFSD
jgi:hypothetical protein